MTIDEARDFIRSNHRAVLATERADGGVAMSPIVVGVDAAGDLVVSTRETAMKTQHVRRTGRASVCVMNDGFFGSWAVVEGPARVISLPEAMEPLVDYYRESFGEHPDWDDYRAAMERERRVLLAITPERAGPTRQG
ncbi:MAG: pyridoxamine 5-phosphate oxidase-related FMN-binding protein [Chloroflexi bacterium]|jgi:PPOX class probable F420-dependent enzyme|nr:pyridoxamine 5-phosphate oxidase-related FMN-binding protein [Chloroflexota bacterium]